MADIRLIPLDHVTNMFSFLIFVVVIFHRKDVRYHLGIGIESNAESDYPTTVVIGHLGMPPASKDSVIYAAIILVGVYVLIGFEVTNYDIEHFAILITYGPYCKKEERLLFPMHFVYKLFITYWLSFILIYRHSYLRYFCLTFRPMIIFHRTASKIQVFFYENFQYYHYNLNPNIKQLCIL